MISTLGISDSTENYLEAILDLEKINRVARGKDIADKSIRYLAGLWTTHRCDRLVFERGGPTSRLAGQCNQQ